MPILKTEDVQSMTREQVDRELRSRHDDVAGSSSATAARSSGSPATTPTASPRTCSRSTRSPRGATSSPSRPARRHAIGALASFLNDPVTDLPQPGAGGRVGRWGRRATSARCSASRTRGRRSRTAAVGVPVRVPTASSSVTVSRASARSRRWDRRDAVRLVRVRDPPRLPPDPVDTLYQANNIGPLMPSLRPTPTRSPTPSRRSRRPAPPRSRRAARSRRPRSRSPTRTSPSATSRSCSPSRTRRCGISRSSAATSTRGCGSSCRCARTAAHQRQRDGAEPPRHPEPVRHQHRDVVLHRRREPRSGARRRAVQGGDARPRLVPRAGRGGASSRRRGRSRRSRRTETATTCSAVRARPATPATIPSLACGGCGSC
jgi:hypothetical protein